MPWKIASAVNVKWPYMKLQMGSSTSKKEIDPFQNHLLHRDFTFTKRLLTGKIYFPWTDLPDLTKAQVYDLLQNYLDIYIFFKVFRLPPRTLLLSVKFRNHFWCSVVILRCTCIANKTFIWILKMGHDAIVFRLSQATCWWGKQLVSPANQKVSSSWVTAAFVTWVLTQRLIN